MGFLSCGNKQTQSLPTNVETNTVKDLKTAIDGEATASAKYAAYARQATREGLPRVTALFQATSKAETFHLRNHLKVLKSIGVENYHPSVQTFSVGTTAQNLKSSIEGEKHECTTMYPKFYADAKGDYEEDAVKTFKWADQAEDNHALLYKQALDNLSHPQKLAKVYFVCPTCGNVYAGKPAETCEICGTTASQFIRFASAS